MNKKYLLNTVTTAIGSDFPHAGEQKAPNPEYEYSL